MGGDFTPLEHGVIALIIQFGTLAFAIPLFHLVPSVAVLSALPGSFCFYGREHAQAESRIKKEWGEKELTWAVTIEAMKFWKWDYGSFMDFFIPVLFNFIASGILLLFV